MGGRGGAGVFGGIGRVGVEGFWSGDAGGVGMGTLVVMEICIYIQIL